MTKWSKEIDEKKQARQVCIVRVDPDGEKANKERRNVQIKPKIEFNVDLLSVRNTRIMCPERISKIFPF